MTEYEVILDGGGPWGIRLQGGKDFGVALNVARVTPGSKAANKRLMAGDQILVINGQETSNLKHTDAQNLIKNAGDRLQLKLKQGKGASLGDIKTVGGGGMQAQPSQTLYTTQVTHSAGVDHKFNSKPRAFGAGDVGATTVTAKKFDPGEYARKKKEELDRYKEEQAKPAVAPDSDVLRMLQRTSISDKGAPQEHGNFSRLQTSLANEGQWKDEDQPKAEFRMTANREMSDVSPGSRVIMDDIKNRGSTGLTSSGSAAGGSKSFKYLQQLTDEDDGKVPPAVSPKPPRKFPSQDENNNVIKKNPSFKMAADNPYHLPIKALVSNEGNPILDSLKSRMKELNIDKDKLDRSHSISNKDKGRYLSHTSMDSAARPASPNPVRSPTSPTSPSFRMTLEKGANPLAGAAGSNDVIASLKNQLSDRMTLGLKQTRGPGSSSSLSRMQKTLDSRGPDGGLHRSASKDDSNSSLLPPHVSTHKPLRKSYSNPLATISHSVPTQKPADFEPFDYNDIIKDMNDVKSQKLEDYYAKMILNPGGFSRRKITPPVVLTKGSMNIAPVVATPNVMSPTSTRKSSTSANLDDVRLNYAANQYLDRQLEDMNSSMPITLDNSTDISYGTNYTPRNKPKQEFNSTSSSNAMSPNNSLNITLGVNKPESLSLNKTVDFSELQNILKDIYSTNENQTFDLTHDFNISTSKNNARKMKIGLNESGNIPTESVTESVALSPLQSPLKPIISIGSLSPPIDAHNNSPSKLKKHVRFKPGDDLTESFVFENNYTVRNYEMILGNSLNNISSSNSTHTSNVATNNTVSNLGYEEMTKTDRKDVFFDSKSDKDVKVPRNKHIEVSITADTSSFDNTINNDIENNVDEEKIASIEKEILDLNNNIADSLASISQIEEPSVPIKKIIDSDANNNFVNPVLTKDGDIDDTANYNNADDYIKSLYSKYSLTELEISENSVLNKNKNIDALLNKYKINETKENITPEKLNVKDFIPQENIDDKDLNTLHNVSNANSEDDGKAKRDIFKRKQPTSFDFTVALSASDNFDELNKILQKRRNKIVEHETSFDIVSDDSVESKELNTVSKANLISSIGHVSAPHAVSNSRLHVLASSSVSHAGSMLQPTKSHMSAPHDVSNYTVQSAVGHVGIQHIPKVNSKTLNNNGSIKGESLFTVNNVNTQQIQKEINNTEDFHEATQAPQRENKALQIKTSENEAQEIVNEVPISDIDQLLLDLSKQSIHIAETPIKSQPKKIPISIKSKKAVNKNMNLQMRSVANNQYEDTPSPASSCSETESETKPNLHTKQSIINEEASQSVIEVNNNASNREDEISNMLPFEKRSILRVSCKAHKTVLNSDKPNLDYSPRRRSIHISESSEDNILNSVYSRRQSLIFSDNTENLEKINAAYNQRRSRTYSESSDSNDEYYQRKAPLLISSVRQNINPKDYNIHVQKGGISMTTLSSTKGKQPTQILAMNHVHKPLTLYIKKNALHADSSDEGEEL